MGLLSEDSLNVERPEEELQIGFLRACGSGGQNVHKFESFVQITRITTGVSVRCIGIHSHPQPYKETYKVVFINKGRQFRLLMLATTAANVLS
ncbi:putative peptide chain release factor class I/class II [Helianthus annuus]|nr:putative peptide chain release factor class I [Helianthus annuus]KAJ0821390.1 putative peptide chain release factor class I/class II [Helianthus annuus]